jgi:arylsulfatase A-like enzyme
MRRREACARGVRFWMGVSAALTQLVCAVAAPERHALRRLELGEVLAHEAGHEMRWAVEMAAGERRSTVVDLTPASRLLVSLLARPGWPAEGFLRFEVLVNREIVHVERVPLPVRDRWQDLSVPLAVAGRSAIELAVAHEAAGPAPAAVLSSRPTVLVGSPRIYPAPEVAPRRVLVWISQDAVRADHLPAYGGARPTTPSFDRWSREFSLFERATATSSWTYPSFASLFTSRYPAFHGAVDLESLRDKRQPTIFQVLSREGFTVLGVTGNHFISSNWGVADGFDALWFTPRHAGHVNNLVREALGSWAGGDLALFVHYMDPHAYYKPPPPYLTRFGSGYRGRVNGANFDGFKAETMSSEDVAHVEALYDGEIAFADQMLGELLGELDGRGLLGDAVIVYSADHGEAFLDHGHWQHSLTLFEELVHVPLAIRVPGAGGRRVSQAVSLVDVAPTILDAFSIPRPESFQGRTLLPLIQGGSVAARPVFTETRESTDPQLAVRDGRLKYILGYRPAADGPPEVIREELFDLESDPRERQGRGEGAELERLRTVALEYLTNANRAATRKGTIDLTPEMKARLRTLGYID